MKLDNFDVVLGRDGATYLAGEPLCGVVLINASRSVPLSRLSVRLSGKAHTGWVNKTSDVVYDSTTEILNDVLDLTTYLLEVSDGELLPEGEHQIGFKFTLPLELISSMHNDYFGWVRYTCSGILELSDTGCLGAIVGLGSNEFVVDKPFTVYSLLNLDAPHFRKPASCTDNCEVVGCFCRKQGNISAQMIVNEQGLLPGETARITLVIENGTRRSSRKKQQCPVVALCQQLDFRAQNKYELHMFDHKSLTLAVESLGTCLATPGQGPETRIIEFPVPHNLPPTSTKSTGLITISYFFKLDLDEFDLIVPVVIGTIKTFDNEELANNCHQKQDSAV